MTVPGSTEQVMGPGSLGVAEQTTTTVNPDGSIAITYADGRAEHITFNVDGSITEAFSSSGSAWAHTKTTTFAGNTITEKVS